jgi:hypothetical protein
VIKMTSKIDQIVEQAVAENANASAAVIARAAALAVLHECANLQEGSSEAEFLLDVLTSEQR